MVRYGHMLDVKLRKIRVDARIEWYSEGSVLAGTIASKCRGVRSHVEVESDEDPALIAALIHNARAGATQRRRSPSPCRSRLRRRSTASRWISMRIPRNHHAHDAGAEP
jgi:hypothetical protein